MRKLLGSIASIVCLAAPAMAADMPVKARPPVVEAVFNWTGFYFGGHVGAAWTNQRATSVDPVSEPASGKIEGSGLIGGGHIGYNLQFAQRFVIGVEADFTGAADLDGSAFDTNRVGVLVLTGGVTFTHDVRWMATARGRLGYAVAPTWLVYGTGGAAWASVHYRTVDIHAAGPAFPAIFDVKDTKSGWVAGGGMEFAFNGNWLFRAEYLHYDIQGAGASGVPRVGFPAELSTFTHGRLRIDAVRGGISYKFGGGPILARF